MAQIYAHPRKTTLFKTLLSVCVALLCNLTYAYAQAPTISSFSPLSGRVGDEVTITGTNLTNTTRVYFGSGSTTDVTVLSSTQIRVKVPVTANPGRLRILTTEGSVYSKTTEIFAMPLAPLYSSMSVYSGSAGTEVTINGSNLAGLTRIYFGSGNTTAITVISNSQVKVVVPATASTAKPILQSNEGRATSTNNFEVSGAPTISNFSPATGAVGTRVTIQGQNLAGATRIYFGSGNTTVFEINEATGEIYVDVPPTATTGAVKVQTNYGQASKSTFTLVGAPTITNISPTEGNAGDMLTITGDNLLDAIRVYVGSGSTTEYTIINENTIQIKIPDAASTSTVRVLTNSGQGSSKQTFTVLQSPIIDNFSPDSGPVGTIVTITGQNFLNATSVSFAGGSTSNFISKTDTEIKVAVPTTAYVGAITVISTTGRKTSSRIFNLEGAPTITSFDPVSGGVDAQVTITGQNLLNATLVYIGSGSIAASKFISKSDNQIVLKVPTLASTGSIRVVTANGQVSTPGVFTVESAPVITSFDPTSGYRGTQITIYGQNFVNVSRVYVGSGSTTTEFTVINDTEIRVTVPNNATTGTLRVQTSGGQIISTGSYNLLSASISLSSNAINFADVPANSSETRQYTVSGSGLANGVPVSVSVGDQASPFLVSLSETTGFVKTLDLNGVANNRLNSTVIYVRYVPTAKGANDGSIVHTQGTASNALALNATAIDPMPVELASFTAKPQGRSVVLAWQTASEVNNSYFDVEVSTGTLSEFTKVARVSSKAVNSSVAVAYSYSHQYNGTAQTLYYRLKQVDVDGTYAYSNILAVDLSAAPLLPSVTVAPNPVTRASKIAITSSVNGKAIIRLNSLTGKQVLYRETVVLRGTNDVPLLHAPELKSGIYLLTVELDGKLHKMKVMKE